MPPTYEALERFNVDFEREHFAYTESGHRVATAMVGMFVGKVPGLPTPARGRGVHALLDEPLLDALGLPRPSRFERRAGRDALRLRARARRALPPRRRPRRRTQIRRSTYPGGHAVEQLGPPPGWAQLIRATVTVCTRSSAVQRPRSSVDRAADFESAGGGSTPPGAIFGKALNRRERVVTGGAEPEVARQWISATSLADLPLTHVTAC